MSYSCQCCVLFSQANWGCADQHLASYQATLVNNKHMRQAQTTSETCSACAIKKKQVDLHLWCLVRIFAIPIHMCLSIIWHRNEIYCACTYRIKHVYIYIDTCIYSYVNTYILHMYCGHANIGALIWSP